MGDQAHISGLVVIKHINTMSSPIAALYEISDFRLKANHPVFLLTSLVYATTAGQGQTIY